MPVVRSAVKIEKKKGKKAQRELVKRESSKKRAKKRELMGAEIERAPFYSFDYLPDSNHNNELSNNDWARVNMLWNEWVCSGRLNRRFVGKSAYWSENFIPL